MTLRILTILTAVAVQLGVLVTPQAALGQIDGADYQRLWNQAIVALVTFADIASPADGKILSADLLARLTAERQTFDDTLVKLISIDPPEPAVRRHLTLVPICQELSAAMLFVTDGVRARDVAVTEAGRRWLTERLIDLRLSLAKLDSR